MGNEQFFRRIAHLFRIVHHQRIRVDVFEQVGRRDVGHVERRVLAHQHHVDRREVQHFGRAERVVIAQLAAHPHRLRLGVEPPVAEDEIVGFIVEQSMAAHLRFHCQHESGIGIDVDAGNVIHLDGDGEAHVRGLRCVKTPFLHSAAHRINGGIGCGASSRPAAGGQCRAFCTNAFRMPL